MKEIKQTRKKQWMPMGAKFVNFGFIYRFSFGFFFSLNDGHMCIDDDDVTWK